MLTILIGLIPAALLRWAIIRKPPSIGVAIGICFAILIGIFILLDAMEMKSTTLPGAVAACSFFILRSGASKTSKDGSQRP